MTRIKRMYPYYGYGPGSYGYPYSSSWSSSYYPLQACEATIDSQRRKIVSLESELSEFRAKKCEDDIKAKVAASPEMARVEDVTAEDGPHAALAEARKILVEAWKAQAEATKSYEAAAEKLKYARDKEHESYRRSEEAGDTRRRAEQEVANAHTQRERYERWLRTTRWIAVLLALVTAAQVAMIDWERTINWF